MRHGFGGGGGSTGRVLLLQRVQQGGVLRGGVAHGFGGERDLQQRTRHARRAEACHAALRRLHNGGAWGADGAVRTVRRAVLTAKEGGGDLIKKQTNANQR